MNVAFVKVGFALQIFQYFELYKKLIKYLIRTPSFYLFMFIRSNKKRQLNLLHFFFYLKEESATLDINISLKKWNKFASQQSIWYVEHLLPGATK